VTSALILVFDIIFNLHPTKEKQLIRKIIIIIKKTLHCCYAADEKTDVNIVLIS